MIEIEKADAQSLSSINSVYRVSWDEAFVVVGFKHDARVYEILKESAQGAWMVSPKYSSVNFAVVNKESDAILLRLALEDQEGEN